MKHCNHPLSRSNNSPICSACQYGKSKRLSSSSSSTQYTAPLELVTMDLWDPTPMLSYNGFCYYISFVDHFMRFTWIVLLKQKEKCFKCIPNIQKPS